MGTAVIRHQTQARLLTAPLAVVLLLCFVLPLGMVLWRAIANPEFSAALPRTAQLLRQWDGGGVPPVDVFRALHIELPLAQENQTLGALSRRLNEERPGMRALLLRTVRALPDLPSIDADGFAALAPEWYDADLWAFMRRSAAPFTATWLLRSVDLVQTPHGVIRNAPPESAVFRPLLLRTLGMAATVTLLCLLLGYPLAWHISALSPGKARCLRALVMVPFWSSVLVRSAAWLVLLQRDGPINAALLALGIVDEPAQLLFTRFAVMLAMTHVLLPFIVLPLSATMSRIDPIHMRAARSMGASGWQAFLRVYLPLSMPGVMAGAAIVFTVAMGYYVTPVLLGGAGDQMIGSFVVYFTNQTVNWGMAAALSTILLVLLACVALLAHRSLHCLRR